MYASGILTVLTIIKKKKDDLYPFKSIFFKQNLCSLMEEVQEIFLLIMFWRPKRSHQIPLAHNIWMTQQDDFTQGWHIGQEKLNMFLRENCHEWNKESETRSATKCRKKNKVF